VKGGIILENLQAFILPIVFLVIFYFLLIRPQQKRDKKLKEMRSGLKVGDEVNTIGGIQGTIVTSKDDIVVIESGAAKTKITIAKWAVGNIINKSDNK